MRVNVKKLTVLTNWMFMVRGSRVMVSFGFKVNFCIEKPIHGVLTWSHYRMDECNIWIADEIDMTPLQVRYSLGKFLPQTRSGTSSTIISYTMEQSVWGTWISCSYDGGVALRFWGPRSLLGSSTWSNSLITGNCTDASAWKHVLIFPPYKNNMYFLSLDEFDQSTKIMTVN